MLILFAILKSMNRYDIIKEQHMVLILWFVLSQEDWTYAEGLKSRHELMAYMFELIYTVSLKSKWVLQSFFFISNRSLNITDTSTIVYFYFLI